MGHTERLPFISAGFEALREPGAFAFRPPAADIRKTGLVWEKAGLPFERRTGCREGPPAPVPDPAPGPAMPSGERPSPAPYIGEERRRRPSEEAHVLREARHLADRGAFQEARERCDACIRKDPGCSDAHFLQGLICLALKEEARAEACFNRTLYLNPHHAEALTYLALLLDCRGEREKAGTIRQRVTRLLERGGGV